MRSVGLSDRRFYVAVIAHGVGAVSWWVFVLSRLMVEVNSFGVPRRYVADYAQFSIFGVGLGDTDVGWTAYTPLSEPVIPINPFEDMNVLSGVVLAALAVTVIAAVVEAVAVRRRPAGVLTIVTPVIGAAIILTALNYGTYGSSVPISATVVFVLVLLGVAVREVWSRVFAPRAVRVEGSADRGRTSGS